jgi:hypothetical protein
MLAARSPLPLLRVLDLENVPVIGEGLEGVVAWFDGNERLVEFWYLYKPHIGELFPEPVHLAHHLVEHGLDSKGPEKVAGLTRQRFADGKLAFEVVRMERSPALGAVLRLSAAGGLEAGDNLLLQPSLPADPRDFGAVHLSRTFDETRVELAPAEAPGDTVTLSKPEVLARIKHPIDKAHAANAVLRKVAGHDLIDSLAVHWAVEEKLNLVAIPKLFMPLWGAYGPCRFEGADHDLVLVWEQAPLRLSLSLPYNDQETPVFTARDLRGPRDAAGRFKEALALDLALRKARWEEKKQLAQLPRYLQWPDLKLGLPREEALQALPQDIRSRPPFKTADGSVGTGR